MPKGNAKEAWRFSMSLRTNTFKAKRVITMPIAINKFQLRTFISFRRKRRNLCAIVICFFIEDIKGLGYRWIMMWMKPCSKYQSRHWGALPQPQSLMPSWWKISIFSMRARSFPFLLFMRSFGNIVVKMIIIANNIPAGHFWSSPRVLKVKIWSPFPPLKLHTQID